MNKAIVFIITLIFLFSFSLPMIEAATEGYFGWTIGGSCKLTGTAHEGYFNLSVILSASSPDSFYPKISSGGGTFRNITMEMKPFFEMSGRDNIYLVLMKDRSSIYQGSAFFVVPRDNEHGIEFSGSMVLSSNDGKVFSGEFQGWAKPDGSYCEMMVHGFINDYEKRLSLLEQWKDTIQNTVNSILEKLGIGGSCTDECAAGSSDCSDSTSPWFCQLEGGCYKKVIEACISGYTCQDAVCVHVPNVKSVIFRTNAISGGYKSGTWIALDFDNDTLLEGWRYLSTSGRLSKCLGTFLLSTPEGYKVYSYQNLPQVCLPISGGVAMVKYGARTNIAEVSSAPVEPYSSRGQEVYAVSRG